jgi:hypothetical protein
MRCESVPVPKIQLPRDAIIKVTAGVRLVPGVAASAFVQTNPHGDLSGASSFTIPTPCWK